MLSLSDTIVAPATPSGHSAVALVRVSGPDTRRLARVLTGAEPVPRRARRVDYRSSLGNLIDDVLVVFLAGPKSYTGEDTLEISCHGNPLIVHQILEDLMRRGCRSAAPGEFTQRAFLNHRMDLTQAEAVMDLIHAQSESALSAASQQLRGSLRERMEQLTTDLLAVLARIEAYIDFPDEDLPPEDRSDASRRLSQIILNTNVLRSTSRYGSLLRDGIKTVILGSPNVGKSSLLNRMVGRNRALVSPEPGTTRDFIEERVSLGNHCLRLIDTAGLNLSPTPLELMGIEKTFERVQEADLVLVVLDATRPELPSIPEPLREKISSTPTITVVNKWDLLPNPGPPRLLADSDSGRVAVSALTGFGIAELSVTITEIANSFRGDTGETIAVSARHEKALEQAQSGLHAASEKLANSQPIELVASDLRGVLESFGEILGRVDNERMLDALFATFCIGK